MCAAVVCQSLVARTCLVVNKHDDDANSRSTEGGIPCLEPRVRKRVVFSDWYW